MEEVGGGKRFAVLLCADDSDYVKKMYGGYFGVFLRMLAEEGESWDLYRVARGEFPDDGEIDALDGFVITGSSCDADSDGVAWICKLLTLLRKLDSMKKKILGICFGHQILCRALGGRTGRVTAGWDIGVTTINFSPPSSSSKLFSSLKMPATIPVIECHRDEVKELPPKAELIGWSDKTGVEMFKYGDHIMGIQGHPEYTKDILLHLLERIFKLDLISSAYVEEVKAKIAASEPDREAWKRLCTKFLKA